MINTKAKGNRRERQAKKELEALGYIVVKSGASLTPFDLVAIPTSKAKSGALGLVQVKSNRITKKERDNFGKITLPKSIKILKEIWIYHDRKGKEIIQVL